jgi:hypothetical protein
VKHLHFSAFKTKVAAKLNFCLFSFQNWCFFLALPRLMMLSHLQNLIGVRGTRTPSILPNDYMDNLLANVKLTMKER